jgi:hypothetical protein
MFRLQAGYKPKGDDRTEARDEFIFSHKLDLRGVSFGSIQ